MPLHQSSRPSGQNQFRRNSPERERDASVKFAFITPRYGAEFSAGAEHACRLLAEQIAKRHDVDVLTTTSRDSATWKNEYSEGSDRVRGAFVRRFAVGTMPERSAFAELSRRLREGPRCRADELSWVRHVGPWSSGLLEHIKRQHRSYDALVFFGLWHPLTVSGLEIAPERSVVFPHLHLRPELRFDLWADVLTVPRAVGYFSNSERRLVHSYVGVVPQYEEVDRHRSGSAAAADLSAAPAGSCRRHHDG